MKRINDRDDFRDLARDLGVRPDWHEPDEQEVTASVKGITFDNAGFWPSPEKSYEEMYVTIYKDYKAVATINLATLCAWAAED